MSFIQQCKKCYWRGPNCPLFPQFDKNDLCLQCQPPKKLSKKERLELENKEKEYVEKSVSFGEDD